MGRRGSLDVPLVARNGNELICVPDGDSTAWTIEPRGHAYVLAFAFYLPLLSDLTTETGLEMLQTLWLSISCSALAM